MDWPLPIRILLWPLSLVYGLAVRSRTALYRTGIFRQKRLKGAVVSVGNITLGGTGKTPMVMWLAEKFVRDGKSVAILSRGYRGERGSSDEVELMRGRLGNRVRFGIGSNRFDQGSTIECNSPVDVFLLDDGFQHLALARDVDIVMLDGSRNLTAEWLLPAGSLREPPSACSRADFMVVTRRFAQPPLAKQFFQAQTRLRGFRKWKAGSKENAAGSCADEIGAGPFFSFCGIGNPAGFADDLKRWQVAVVGSRVFRDHHKYSQNDLAALESAAIAAGAAALVTTEKDEQNLPAGPGRLPVYVVVIDLVMNSERELLEGLDRLLNQRRGVAL